MSWVFFQEDWSQLHTVTFDGVNKLIIIGENTSELSIKRCYSMWKEWSRLRDNTKYLPAFRATGGDPVSDIQFSGDIYFLINGWRILISHSCVIDGVIYSDDFPSPFLQVEGTQIVTNKVSSLVTTIAPKVTIDGISVPSAEQTAQAVWEYSNRTVPQNNTIETKIDQVRSAVDSKPSAFDIASEVWNTSTVSAIATGTFGLLLNQLKASDDLLNSRVEHLINAMATATEIVQTILKYSTNRTKLDPVNNSLTIYDNDGTTPLKTFDLKDINGLPSVEEIAERVPR